MVWVWVWAWVSVSVSVRICVGVRIWVRVEVRFRLRVRLRVRPWKRCSAAMANMSIKKRMRRKMDASICAEQIMAST